MLKLKTAGTVERERERERVTLLINSVASLSSIFFDCLNFVKNKIGINKDSFRTSGFSYGF